MKQLATISSEVSVQKETIQNSSTSKTAVNGYTFSADSGKKILSIQIFALYQYNVSNETSVIFVGRGDTSARVFDHAAMVKTGNWTTLPSTVTWTDTTVKIQIGSGGQGYYFRFKTGSSGSYNVTVLTEG